MEFEVVSSKSSPTASDMEFELVGSAPTPAPAPVPVPPAEPPTKWQLFKQGFGQGATGLTYDAVTGGTYKPPTLQPTTAADEVVGSLGGFLSDFPWFLATGPAGLLGGPFSAATVPAVAMGSTEAYKAYLRGESPEDISKATLKGAAIGGIMGPAGKIGQIPGINKYVAKMALPLELGGGAVVSSALEGKETTPTDVASMAFPLIGLRAAGKSAEFVKKTLESKNIQDLAAVREAAAEKANLPQIAPQAGGPGTLDVTLAREGVVSGAAGAAVANRRRRQIDKDVAERVQQKAEMQRDFLVDRQKSLDEASEDRVIIDPDTEKQVDLQGVGEEAKAAAKAVVEGAPSVAGVDETSVQKLSKAAITDEEFKDLLDRGILQADNTEEALKAGPYGSRAFYNAFISEKSDIKKMSRAKQRAWYDRVTGKDTEPVASEITPEAFAKVQDFQRKVHDAILERKSRKADVASLKEYGYNDKQISEMDDYLIARRARTIRGETDSVKLDEELVGKLTEIEAQSRSITDRIRKGEEIPEEELDAVLKAVVDVDMDEVIDPIVTPPALLEIDADGFHKMTYKQFTDRRAALVRANEKRLEEIKTKTAPSVSEIKPKVVRRRLTQAELKDEGLPKSDWESEEIQPASEAELLHRQSKERAVEKAKRSGAAEDYEAILRDEGMPAELNFDALSMPRGMKLIMGGDFDAYMKHVGAKSALSKVVAGDYLKLGDLNYQQARTLRGALYTYRPETKSEAIDWYRRYIEPGEVKASEYDRPLRMAFSRKAISAAVADGRITKTQRDYMLAVLKTLKVQPDFRFEVANLTKKDSGLSGAGVFDLLNNIIKVRDPAVTAHEVVHWAFFNVIEPKERMTYYRDFINDYYKADGNLDVDKMAQVTSDFGNALVNPAELFACRGSDYHSKFILTPTERTLLQKIRSWWDSVVDSVSKFSREDYSDVSKIMDKVFDDDYRRHWATEDDTFQGEIWKEPAYKGPYKDLSYDALGLDSVRMRAATLINAFKKANRNSKGAEILGAVKGEGDIPRNILSFARIPQKRSVAYNALGPYTISPMTFAKNTKMEPLVFDVNMAEMFIGHMYDVHQTTIRNIEKGHTEQTKINVTKVMRGELEGTPLEQEMAGEARQWLEDMRGRIKARMLVDFKSELNKNEYNALLDLASGWDIKEVDAKYSKIKTEDIEDIWKKYQEIDNWGIDDYVPNVEMGRFKLLVDATTEDGKHYKKLIGVGLSEGDAARKAIRWLEKNPKYLGDISIDTSFRDSMLDKTTITRAQYFGMMNSLQKKIMESMAGIEKEVAKKMASSTLRRKFNITPTDVWSPFLQERNEILKGEENIFPVLRSYAYSIEKKLALDPVIDKIRRSLPSLNPEERAYMIQLIDDVKGRYGRMDKIVDNILTSWGVSTYRGYSRSIGGARALEANLKLGARPIAAGINLASGQMHTWVKVGWKYYKDGIKFLGTPEGRAFLEEVKPYLGTTLAVDTKGAESKTPWYMPLGMFQMAEPVNREVSVAANYLKAIAEGAKPEVAKEIAIRANWVEQFTYNIANLPQIMRGPTGKLITQFKPYLLKELEFMSTLSGRDWGRYAAMQLILGGPRGLLMIARSVPFLALLGFWNGWVDDVEEWMNKNAPVLSRGIAALPGAISPELGMDVSGPTTFQFPSSLSDLVGPLFSDIGKLYENVLLPMTTYGPWKEDLKRTAQIAPIAKHYANILEYYVSKDNWLKDGHGNYLYQVPSTIPFILQSVMGAENIDLNRIRSEEGILNRRDARSHGEVTRVLNSMMEAVTHGEPFSQRDVDLAMKHGVTEETLIRRIENSQTPPDIRAILKSEVTSRYRVIQMYPVPGDYTP